MKADHRDHIRESPGFLDPLLYHQHQQLDNQSAPYLNFNSIWAIAKEIFKGEVLFESLKHGLDLPSVFINITDFLWANKKIVGDEPIHFSAGSIQVGYAPKLYGHSFFLNRYNLPLEDIVRGIYS